MMNTVEPYKKVPYSYTRKVGASVQDTRLPNSKNISLQYFYSKRLNVDLCSQSEPFRVNVFSSIHLAFLHDI